MNMDFCEDVLKKILNAIVKGRSKFVFWGFNENCIKVLSELKKLGLLEFYTSGIIDQDIPKQGNKIYNYEILPPERIPEIEIDVLVILFDAEKEKILKMYSTIDPRTPDVIISGTRHLEFNDPVFDSILNSCLVKSYATGYPNSQIHIYQSIKYLSDNSIRGNVAEFGIFKGGTIVFIVKVLRHFGFKDINIYGFEIFEGFPQRRSIMDLYSNIDCEYQDYETVSEYCKRYNIEVIKGDICETFNQIKGVPLMFSFFDTDNYSPTRKALELCFNQTVKGGILAFDHYFSSERFIDTIGERIAAKEVLDSKKVFHLHETGIFIKL